jgi:hypothetical protein
MRSLGTRRVALAAGVATVAVIALAGCSAGQVAETAYLDAPVSGVNTQSTDGGLLIRNLQVTYSSTTGYPAGGNAPLEVALYNETQRPITVVISSSPPQGEVQGVVSARQVGLTGGAAAASPSANPEPSGSIPSGSSSKLPDEQVPETGQPTTLPPTSAPAVAAQPARITIEGLSSVVYRAGDDQALQLIGLTDELRPGNSVNLNFQVSTTNQPVNVLAPVAIPLSPASRAPGIDPHENLGGEQETGEEGS